MRHKLSLLSMMVFAVSFCAQAQNDVLTRVAQELADGKYEGVTSGMLSMRGNVLFEAYAPGYNANKRHDIRSATKSITALLIGALIDEGKLKNTRVKLSSILSEEFIDIPRGDPKRAIRIADLLTMRGGLACNDWAPSSVGNEDKMYKTDDWFQFWIRQPLAYEVGEHFSYCTGGVVALGRVIERLSGMSVPEYANLKLFERLGIADAKWDKTPTGNTDTGGHLQIKLKDLQTLGLLVAQQGRWQDKQLISKRWIKAMTEPQTRIPERRQQYGYLWWYDNGTVNDMPVTIMYAHGNGGNFIFIVPELEIVAAFTGKNYGKPSQFTALRIFSREIVPAIAQNK